MKHLSIDLETYCSVPIATAGMYKYVQSADFEILLFAYSVDGAQVQIIDLAQGETVPDWLIDALKNPEYIKHAYNAVFEWYCLSKFCGEILPIEQWRDTMLHGLYCGYTAGLEATGAAVGLEEDKRKLTTGKALIRYFSVPCKPTKSNGGRTRNLPKHDLEKWDLFKEYCMGDVVTEMEIEKKLSNFPVPADIQEQWQTDIVINSRGVAVDMDLVYGALEIAEDTRQQLMAEAIEITGLENPNSVAQLSKWLTETTGQAVSNLRKDTVAEMLDFKKVTGDAARVLRIRQELGKTSTKKYDAIKASVCEDGHVRGLLQFYGASRTGRWSGRIIQIQNIVRTKIGTALLPIAREAVKKCEVDKLNLLFGSTMDTLSQLIRTAFVASNGNKLIDADFSSIEARIVSWLAKEEWKLEAFKAGKDIYCETASAMFGVPVEKHGINAELRQKGKIAELACIAEGQMVLTDKGLVPIESITINHRLWDGEEWVKHDGVVYRGEREVITYDGLTATPDHLVWIEGASQPVHFGVAAASGVHLLQTGKGAETEHLNGNKAKVYDIRNAGSRNRFTVSNCLVHNCGYAGGKGALIAMGALDMGIPEDDLPEIVARWRQANRKIVDLWYRVEKAAIMAVETGRRVGTNGLVFAKELDYEHGLDFLTITLPSRRKLYYAHPELSENAWGKPLICYWGVDQTTKQWSFLDTFGGKIVENCLSGETKVLTSRGWILLKDVTIEDKVWDGQSWVSHEGLINKGIQKVIEVDGVEMTPDHLVLTKAGWKNASTCKRYNRREVALPNGNFICRLKRKKIGLEDSLRLRQRIQYGTKRISKRQAKIMRLQTLAAHQQSKKNARKIQTSNVSSLAINERALSCTNSSSLEQLRRTWNQSLSALVGEFREFLGRYASNLSSRSEFGSNRRERGLLSGELPLDYEKNTSSKHTEKPNDKHTMGCYDSCRSVRKIKNRRNNNTLSVKTGVVGRYVVHQTRCCKQVYDLKNAGKNHCFTVMSSVGPMLVHNCVQGIARDCLAIAIQRLEAAGYPIVFHVHDEVVIDCAADKANLNDVVRIMTTPIPWAQDLPMNADGWIGDFFRKD